ncbi:MAG TPA: septum formation family protein [Acidimicrobiia bacterium]|nr:septum formation family protein [Acidimicrobiia bacterium]
MDNGERKSSDDLIREANERLRGSSETGEDPVAPTEPSSPVPDPEPRELEYRSRAPQSDPDGPTVTDPIEDDSEPRSWASVGLVRWVVIALLLGGGYLFSTFGDADRGESGEIVSAGDLEVMSLQVGDCFDDPEDLEDVVYDVAAVPCIEPHDNEVFAVASLADAFPRAFPGQDALWEYSYDVCSGSLFDSFVGTPYLESSLDVFSFTPTQESWDDGDREFVCAVFRLDGEQLTGSARESGL